MRRREFIVAGVALGAPLLWPGLASAGQAPVQAHWLVSRERAADPLVRALTDAGASVTRVPDEAAALWYDHVSPVLDRGLAVRGVTGEGSGFLLGQLAHLRGRLMPARHPTAAIAGSGLEAWEILPRLNPARSERTQ